MPIPTVITDLSQTASLNYPQGTDSPSTLDDVQRADGAFIAMLRDGKGLTNPVVLASGTTTDIGGQNSQFVEISGTTTITGFGTTYNGPRYLRFQASLTLTHNATTLNLPTGGNIVTVAGDTCVVIPNQALNGWNVVEYAGKSVQATNGTFGAINGPIGATTPAAGNFTSVTSSGNITTSGAANIATSGTGNLQTFNAVEVLNSASAYLYNTGSSTYWRLRNNANNLEFSYNTTLAATFTSTGLAVTGALSSTGNISTTGTVLVGSGYGQLTYDLGYFGILGLGSNSLKLGAGGVFSATLDAAGNLGLGVTPSGAAKLEVAGIVAPSTDNTRTLGTGALRWSTVYAGTGTINTSDAREKTAVSALTTSELNAAKQLSKEIGTYKFLASVQSKGDAARSHVGMTVQRAIEIMEANGLSPFNYGFICHDVWEDKFTEHPAIEAVAAVEAKPAEYQTVTVDEVVVVDGVETIITRTKLQETKAAVQAVAAVEAKAAWSEQTQWAGDRYAFRYDQLTLFIAAGIEARMSALEAA